MVIKNVKAWVLAVIVMAGLSVSVPSLGMDIIQAIGNNDLAQVQKIVKQDGIDVSKVVKSFKSEGWTPLHIACMKNGVNPEIIRLLLENGADVNVNQLDMNWQTPLHSACCCDAAIVKLLLQYGAAKSIYQANKQGQTPYDLAFKNNKQDIIRLFKLDIFGAIESGNLQELGEFIKIDKLSVNIINKDGMTPLFYALYKCSSLEIVQELLENGADANKVVNYGSFMSVAPLYVACAKGDLGFVKLLLEYGAVADKEAISIAEKCGEQRDKFDKRSVWISEIKGIETKGKVEILMHLILIQDYDNAQDKAQFILDKEKEHPYFFKFLLKTAFGRLLDKNEFVLKKQKNIHIFSKV
jgi:FOG: Ankyrin repeat